MTLRYDPLKTLHAKRSVTDVLLFPKTKINLFLVQLFMIYEAKTGDKPFKNFSFLQLYYPPPFSRNPF